MGEKQDNSVILKTTIGATQARVARMVTILNMPIKISQQFDAGAVEVLRADTPQAIDLNIRKDSHADISQWFYFRRFHPLFRASCA